MSRCGSLSETGTHYFLAVSDGGGLPAYSRAQCVCSRNPRSLSGVAHDVDLANAAVGDVERVGAAAGKQCGVTHELTPAIHLRR
jgi:hypothetical protein